MPIPLTPVVMSPTRSASPADLAATDRGEALTTALGISVSACHQSPFSHRPSCPAQLRMELVDLEVATNPTIYVLQNMPPLVRRPFCQVTSTQGLLRRHQQQHYRHHNGRGHPLKLGRAPPDVEGSLHDVRESKDGSSDSGAGTVAPSGRSEGESSKDVPAAIEELPEES